MLNGLSLRAIAALLISKTMICMARIQNKYFENNPGRVALRICPDFLAELSANVHSIVITGTNGKTTTARFVENILKADGRVFFFNREGANLEMRVATLFADNHNCLGTPLIADALLECDERALYSVAPRIHPEYIIITNIYPDQKSRLVSEEHVADMIYYAMKETKPAVCIIHKDCHFKEKIESLPLWKFIEYSAHDGLIDIYGNEYSLSMLIPGRFNMENAAAAATLCEQLGIPADVVIKGIETTKPAFGRFEQFKSGKNEITLCLAKNTQGFIEIAHYLNGLSKSGAENLIVAVNKSAGDDRDTEWLYKIPSKTIESGFQTVTIAGECVPDLKKLFLRDGITPTEITFDNIPLYTSHITGKTFIIANYSAMMTIRYKFVECDTLCQYWEN